MAQLGMVRCQRLGDGQINVMNIAHQDFHRTLGQPEFQVVFVLWDERPPPQPSASATRPNKACERCDPTAHARASRARSLPAGPLFEPAHHPAGSIPIRLVSAALTQSRNVRSARSTIANWHRRGRVPERYAALADEDAQRRLVAAFNFDLLSLEERAALILAIMRMQKGLQSELSSGPDFLRRGSFIPVQVTTHVEQALRDLLAEMERKGYDDPLQCLNEMVFNELFASQLAESR